MVCDQLAEPSDAIFVDSRPSFGVAARVESLRELRRWSFSNLRQAQEAVPRFEPTFRGVVVAGRRDALGQLGGNLVKHVNETLPGITIRTYDWIIDALAEVPHA